jgi:hypothetical protein
MKKYFKELDRLDIEYPDQKPVIVRTEACCVESDGDLLICTGWTNGEGYELTFTNSKGNDKYVSLHRSEIEALLRALRELKYF